MHQKRPFLTRKGDTSFSRGSTCARKGDVGFKPTQTRTSKGDMGFRQAGHPVDRAQTQYPWAASGPGWVSRRRAEPDNSDPAPLVWRAPEGPEGQAAVPVGGGGAWPGFEIDHSEPQARVWRSRGRAAAHGRTKQPGPNMASNAAHGKPVGSEAITTRRAARAGIVRGSG